MEEPDRVGPLSDDEIVRGVLAGEREAYRLLVERYAPMVFSLVRGFCRDPDAIEDLAQEVFVKAYENLSGFGRRARFSSWLYSIARNHGLDHARRSATAGPHRFVGTEETVASGLDTPQEALEKSEEARRLRWALDQLEPDYAVPFLLKYDEDLSYSQMAAMLDTTAGALKVRVHRARMRLRDLLEGGT